MITERVLHSAKAMGLILFLVTVSIAYIVYDFTQTNIIYGTIVVAILLGYIAYYAHIHSSPKEVLAVTTLTTIAIIAGLIIGIALNGYRSFGATLYASTLSVSLLVLLYLISRSYR
ncbi:MAG: hypothetical protein J7L82_01125 [Staphylothermus sp.]|nr:hypothetical protein [Staphylothermus sp.]